MYKNSLKNKNMPRTTHQSKSESLRIPSINDEFQWPSLDKVDVLP